MSVSLHDLGRQGTPRRGGLSAAKRAADRRDLAREHFRRCLAQHVGRGRALSAETLAATANVPARTLRGWLAGEALPPYDQLLGLMAALPLDARLDLAEPLRLDGTAMQASERPALLMDLYRACADFIALSGPAIEAGRPPRAAELRRISAEATRLSAEIRRFRVTHRPFLGEGWIGEGQIGEGQNEDAPAGSSAGASSVDRLTA